MRLKIKVTPGQKITLFCGQLSSKLS